MHVFFCFFSVGWLAICTVVEENTSPGYRFLLRITTKEKNKQTYKEFVHGHITSGRPDILSLMEGRGPFAHRWARSINKFDHSLGPRLINIDPEVNSELHEVERWVIGNTGCGFFAAFERYAIHLGRPDFMRQGTFTNLQMLPVAKGIFFNYFYDLV